MNEDVRRLEELVGKAVPEDLVRFYRGEIGPAHLPGEFDVPDDPIWFDHVENLYSLKQTIELLEYDKPMHQYGVRDLAMNTIPVGDNGNGDFISLSVRDEDFGAVRCMFHETTDPEDDSLEGAFLLAPSFSRFLKGLRRSDVLDGVPDWEGIREAELQRILNAKKSSWWKFWGK